MALKMKREVKIVDPTELAQKLQNIAISPFDVKEDNSAGLPEAAARRRRPSRS